MTQRDNRNKQSRDYENLLALSRQAKNLEGISSILHWDQETYMPLGGAEIRSEQIETISGLIHQQRTGSKFKTALGKLIDIETGVIIAADIDKTQIAALKAWHRDYLKAMALPTQFVKDFAKLTSQAIEAWKVSRQTNNFNTFAPFLEKIVDKCREKAELVGYQENPYDALLDDYEHDISTKEISKLFSSLSKSLSSLLKKINAATPVDDSFLHGKFNHDKQMQLGMRLLKEMGYDLSKGRLDLSAHPFSSSCHPTDSRITSRIHPTSLMSHLSVILHEGGHSLYEMGLPVEHYGSPLCEAISLGMHESQSRWWETRIGQSKPFWQYYLPILKKTFHPKLENVSLLPFYQAINKVKPSCIRVEADEVTYSLHVILRFELECALIQGSIKVAEIPEAWRAKMQEYLGIVPKTDSEGCLQDIHWSMGAFGYFPTYALGNMYAAQLFETFEKDHPEWKEVVAQGKLGFINTWLHQAVHQHGRRYSSKELLKKVTGKKFSEEPFLRYLNTKYAEIYH